MSIPHPLLPRLRDHQGRGSKGFKSQSWEMTYSETMFSGHYRASAHMNSQKLWQHAKDLCKLKSGKIPARKGMGIPHSSLRSYWQLIASGIGELVFFKTVALVGWPRFNGWSHSQAYMDSSNGIQVYNNSKKIQHLVGRAGEVDLGKGGERIEYQLQCISLKNANF